MKKYLSIAIDGPAGSGKSTIANKLTKKIPNFVHINTGAMYRALGYFFDTNNIDYLNDEQRIKFLNKVKISIDNDKVFINYENHQIDVTDKIHNEHIAAITSTLSSFYDVREKLVCDQQLIAQSNNVIMDGRDIGTVVLPNATLKIFLDASVEKRVKRRLLQLKENNIDCDPNEIRNQIIKRDYDDINRKNGPLKKADDAIVLFTDDKTIDECCEFILNKLN